MIKNVGKGLYKVFSEKTGKPLSRALSKKRVVARLGQIEYFKHHKK